MGSGDPWHAGASGDLPPVSVAPQKLELMIAKAYPLPRPPPRPPLIEEAYSPGSLGNGDQQETFLGCFKFLFLNFRFIAYQELITTSMLHMRMPCQG